MEASCLSSIDLLPLEIQLEIFSYLRICDVLLSCRLVSKKLKEIATDFCSRDSRVKLILPESEVLLNAPIAKIFKAETLLPFSNAEISITSNCHVTTAFSQNVSRLYGNHIKSLEVTLEPLLLDTVMFTLCYYPNIVSLDITICYYDDESTFNAQTFEYNAFKKLKLPCLKVLKVDVQIFFKFFKFLKLLIDSSARIEEVDLRFSQDYLEEPDFTKLIDLVRKVPKLALGFRYDPTFVAWKELVDLGPIRIQKLQLRSIMDENEGTFDLLTQFLRNCRGLKTLTLTDFHQPRKWNTTPQFQIPDLVDLTKLKFRMESCGSLHEQTSVVQFVPLGDKTFPKLKVVSIKPWYGGGVMNFDPKNLFPVLEGQGPTTKGHGYFDHVETLKLRFTKTIGSSWSSVFPNLRQLKASINEAGQLPPLLQGMSQLSDLDITIDQDVGDVHSIVYELVGTHPSLENTQTITIRSYPLLDDRTVIMMALLPPMRLTIYNAKISANTVSILNNRHQMFLFYTECPENIIY